MKSILHYRKTRVKNLTKLVSEKPRLKLQFKNSISGSPFASLWVHLKSQIYIYGM
jgi:hypothetical protein